MNAKLQPAESATTRSFSRNQPSSVTPKLPVPVIVRFRKKILEDVYAEVTVRVVNAGVGSMFRLVDTIDIDPKE